MFNSERAVYAQQLVCADIAFCVVVLCTFSGERGGRSPPFCCQSTGGPVEQSVESRECSPVASA